MFLTSSDADRRLAANFIVDLATDMPITEKGDL
jgi:hypothetical protein